MTYALAKELREAGYSQEFKMGHWICDLELFDIQITDKAGDCYGDALIYHPTLSELIEECGDGYFSLGRDTSGMWRCYMKKDQEYMTDIDPTPEEAVARLWLALNKK